MFEDKEYLKFIQTSKKNSCDIVGISVVETVGSTYAKAGNLMLINSKQEFIGVFGSRHLHDQIFEYAKTAFETKQSRYFENIPKDDASGHGTSRYFLQAFFLEDDYGLLGKALNSFDKTLIRDIKDDKYEFSDEKIELKYENGKFYQPVELPYSLLVFGSGAHVTSLISMANLMGWKTTVIDIAINSKYVDEADELIELENFEDIFSMDLNPYNASVILSHNPKTDDSYLEALLDSKVEYIGLMGNKQNMQRITEEFNLLDDARFFAPVGFDIGGNRHQSIALSI
ncbi:MAG: XdhC/CoxI family protein, partial [Thiovulaceae bacterium]|nr:XdhC/CoxI family protein [Sulfurimonadaceae bacterium]